MWKHIGGSNRQRPNVQTHSGKRPQCESTLAHAPPMWKHIGGQNLDSPLTQKRKFKKINKKNRHLHPIVKLDFSQEKIAVSHWGQATLPARELLTFLRECTLQGRTRDLALRPVVGNVRKAKDNASKNRMRATSGQNCPKI